MWGPSEPAPTLRDAWLIEAKAYAEAKAAGDLPGQCEHWDRLQQLLDQALEEGRPNA